MKIPAIFTKTSSTLALLPLRIGIGISMFYHGAQKLFGWYGGKGLDATAKGFAENLGLEPGIVMASLAGGAEFLGGIGLIIGFATRLWGAAIAFTMGVAIYTVHLDGFWGGMEKPMILLLGSLTLMIAGAGRLSVDYGSSRS